MPINLPNRIGERLRTLPEIFDPSISGRQNRAPVPPTVLRPNDRLYVCSVQAGAN